MDLAGQKLFPIRRKIGNDELARGVLAISGKKARLSSRGVERVGLSETLVAAAEADYRKQEPGKATEGVKFNYPDRIYRAVRGRPLFVLYNISIKDEDVPERLRSRLPEGPVVGWAISFPRSSRPDATVEYVLNSVKVRELFGEDDGTDEDELDD